jgi:hypothetical protein
MVFRRRLVGGCALPGLLGGPDEEFVDRHPAVAGHDIGRRVGDVVWSQRLDRCRLAIPQLDPLTRPTVFSS